MTGSSKSRKGSGATSGPQSEPSKQKSSGRRDHYSKASPPELKPRDARYIAALTYGPELGDWRQHLQACRNDVNAGRLPMALGALMALRDVLEGAVTNGQELEGPRVAQHGRNDIKPEHFAEIVEGFDHDALVSIPVWVAQNLVLALFDLWSASDMEWSREHVTGRKSKGYTQIVAAKLFGAMADGSGNRPALQRRAVETMRKKMALQIADLLDAPKPPKLVTCLDVVARRFTASVDQAREAWATYGEAAQRVVADRPK